MGARGDGGGTDGNLRSAFLPTDRLNLDVTPFSSRSAGNSCSSIPARATSSAHPRKMRSACRRGVQPCAGDGRGDQPTPTATISEGRLDGAETRLPHAAYSPRRPEVTTDGARPDMAKLRIPREQEGLRRHAKRYLRASRSLTGLSGQKSCGAGVVSAPAIPRHIALLASSGKERC